MGRKTITSSPPASPQAFPKAFKTLKKSGSMDGMTVDQTDAASILASHPAKVRDTSVKSRVASTFNPAEPVAGRGMVTTSGSGYVKKQMTNWEVKNYIRLQERFENKGLSKYLAREVLWKNTGSKVHNLREDQVSDEDRGMLDIASTTFLHPVKMTDASPSRTALDVKLGDINYHEGDLLHGKNSLLRSAKSWWHYFKQTTNKSGVTIQTTSSKVGREFSELRQDRDFIKLMLLQAEKAGVTDLNASGKVQKMINELRGLREAVSKSSVGFVGSSVLLSFSDQDQMVTLIDLENCIMPEDVGVRPKITRAVIESQKANFIAGINTLITHLSDLLPPVEI